MPKCPAALPPPAPAGVALAPGALPQRGAPAEQPAATRRATAPASAQATPALLIAALAGLGLLALIILGAGAAQLLLDELAAPAAGHTVRSGAGQAGQQPATWLTAAGLAFAGWLGLAGAWRLRHDTRTGAEAGAEPVAEAAPDRPLALQAGPLEAAASVSPAPLGSQDASHGAARIGTLAPLLTRLIEALPGRALLVWREQTDRPWQLVQVHDAWRVAVHAAGHEAGHEAGHDATHDTVPGAAHGAAPAVGLRVLHPLGPPYPVLADWLAGQTRWTATDVIAALGGHSELGPRVLPLDSCTAVVWLEPQAGAAASADSALAPPMAPEPGASDSADRERETFLYTVSHDLRAPIRVIEGFTRIVKEDYGALLDRVGNDHLDRVLGASTRMTAMIDALLGLSRLSTQALQHEQVDLSALAAQVIDELRRQSPERQAEVSIEPGLHAQGDPTLLRLVLDNLLGNAWKYSARRELTRISLSARPAVEGGSSRRIYTVQDHGAGFDMRFAERLFGPFQRLHSAREFAGTGVGLATVRRIVRRHGGDVWADAEVDRGASFHFTLD